MNHSFDSKETEFKKESAKMSSENTDFGSRRASTDFNFQPNKKYIFNRASLLPGYSQLLASAGIAEEYEPISNLSPPLLTPYFNSRTRLQPKQVEFLTAVFEKSMFPPTIARQKMASHLGLSPRTIQNWFQNKRQKLRAAAKASEKPFPSSLNESIDDLLS